MGDRFHITTPPAPTLDERIAATPAPKVTLDRVNAVIKGEDYHKLNGTLTVCVLTLVNGFTVTGESACASPENYDKQIGEELSRRAAVTKIWTLEAYLLKQFMHDEFSEPTDYYSPVDPTDARI